MKILTNYTLKIGYQKSTTNITGYTHITDKVEYTAQHNYYAIVPYSNETMILNFGDITVGANLKVTLYDADGNVILNQNVLVKNDSILLENPIKGKEYMLVIESNNRKITPYTIDITYK